MAKVTIEIEDIEPSEGAESSVRIIMKSDNTGEGDPSTAEIMAAHLIEDLVSKVSKANELGETPTQATNPNKDSLN